jgi:Solute carrier family 35
MYNLIQSMSHLLLHHVRAEDKSSMENHSITGDMLCLAGASLYGCLNVMQENIVKRHDRSVGTPNAHSIGATPVQLYWKCNCDATHNVGMLMFHAIDSAYVYVLAAALV